MKPSDNKSLYLRWREKIRFNPLVAKGLYLAQSLKHSNVGDFRAQVVKARKTSPPGNGVALCVRIRDEAPYLAEYVEYYLAAGVSQIFFYEKLSQDRFREALTPFIHQGVVTLLADWPHIPISPAAEQDAVLRSIGRFEWVGMIDADEFVVIHDGRAIGEFLSGYKQYPAVALHWRGYGSSGHKTKPAGPVIVEYTQREPHANRHVKCFVQPHQVAAYRNCHSWYYLGMRCAVNELRQGVFGSISQPPTDRYAWINHFHHKSDEEYFAKANRKSVSDRVGMKFYNRSQTRHEAIEKKANEIFDDSSLRYYRQRCQQLQREPKLLLETAAVAKQGIR